MPSHTLNIILNYDRSRRFPLVDKKHHKEGILRAARNKFNVKGLSSVFFRGGIHLDDDAAIPDQTSEVWVGKGEPYSGPHADHTATSIRGEVRVIDGKSFIDDRAIKQLDVVSRLPGVRLAVGMPDLHPGDRFPIGCAVAAEGIYPALIGSDVGCGIGLYRLSSSSRTLSDPKKLASLLSGLDEPWDGPTSEWLALYGVDRSSPFDESSLGTVGAGNHFAEICAVDKVFEASVANTLGIEEKQVYLLVHTGSRGLGKSILDREKETESNPYILPDSPHLSEYLADHDYAVTWAVANRDLVAHRIKQCLTGNGNEDKQDKNNISSATIQKLEKIVDVTHNSATKHNLTANGWSEELWVHRKGAAPADLGIVPCPGSRGDYTWLLRPTGDGQLNGRISILAHGAGRRHARNVMAGKNINKSSLTTTSLGSVVICTDPKLLLEERPEAYKDVQCVVDDMEEHGVCLGVVKFRPVVTFKTQK
ncbi:tRNA-splicing ligase [Cyathus striatus]|nr:tRNA-splicing ligase [Cyathus striatus]